MPKKTPSPLACYNLSTATNAYDLLEEVKEIIKTDPKRYNQTFWLARSVKNADPLMGGWGDTNISPHPRPALKNQMSQCGTMGCVAGWIGSLKFGKEALHEDVQSYAQKILGLTDIQAETLFHDEAAGDRDSVVDHADRGIAHITAFQQRHEKKLRAKRIK